MAYGTGIFSNGAVRCARIGAIALAALVLVTCIRPASAAVVAGRTPTSFTVSNSGAANYTIPIWTPPGVGAVQLQLALSYSSRSPDGVIGMGWSISGLSAISRCNKSWAQDGAPASVTLTTSDRFCLDGQQLKLVSGTYGVAGSVYATEIESFSAITATGTVGNGPASFTVTTKNGLIYDYGLTSDAEIIAGSSGTIRTWALSQIRDRVGNKINFSYTNDSANGSYRIASITYPTTATGQGPFYEVLFSYVARPTTDIPSAYVDGYATRELNQLNTITIETYPADTVIKSYSLSYNQGTATNRLRLTSVQECSASNCFPATTIGYQDGVQGWATTAQSTGQTTTNPAGVLALDLNGDGITDIVYPVANNQWQVVYGSSTGVFSSPQSLGITAAPQTLLLAGDLSGHGATDILYPNGQYWYRLYWTGSGLSTANTNVLVNSPQGTAEGWTVADVNGDGLPDLVFVVNTDVDTTVYVQFNTTTPGSAVSFGAPVFGYNKHGSGNTTWKTVPGALVSGTYGTSELTVADFNGDGRADLLIQLEKIVNTCPPPIHGPSPPCGQTTTYYWTKLISNGTSFTADGLNYQVVALSHIVTLDWNGDGCTDVALPGNGWSGDWTVYLSDCGTTGYSNSVGIDTGLPYNDSVIAIDWDGDGRQDLLGGAPVGPWYVARSTGEGVAPGLIVTGILPGNNVWFVGDFDGDGQYDLGFSDWNTWNTLKVNLRSSPGTPPDLATSFTDGFSINQSPTYAPLTSSTNVYQKCDGTTCPTATFPEVDFAGPLYVVSGVTASDGSLHTNQQVYTYYGATLQQQGRGFEGFLKRRVLDIPYNVATPLVTYDFVQRPFPYTGILSEQDVYQKGASNYPPDGSHVSTWVGTTNNQTLGSGYQTRTFPFLSSTTDDRYEYPSAAFITQAVTNYTYGDGYGNQTVIATTTTDEDSGSPFYGSWWSTTVNNTFSNTPSTNCFGLPTITKVQNVVPGQTTQTRTYNYMVDPTYCRVTQQDIEPSTAPLHVNTTLGFDSCGNVNSAAVTGHNPDGTAMATRTTLFNYSYSTSRCQLPERVTNALGQSTSIVYNYNFGVPSSVTDPNTLATSWVQDDFGRLTKETRPDGTYTSRGYGSCLNGACGPADLVLDAKDLDYGSDSSFVTQREVLTDGLDRVRYDESYRALGTYTYNAILQYDGLGRRLIQYQPYSSSSNGYRAWTYDGLNRPTAIQLVQPSGTLDRTTGISYAGRTTSITDPLGNRVQRVSDVMARLRRVIDPSPGGTTYYDFDAFGNLNKITDAIGAVSSGTYNLRGFRTQWADADRGTWNFVGDSLNELVSWTDAKSQSFGAIYDAIGRVTSRTEPEGTSVWTWDTRPSTCPQGAGYVGRPTGATGYSYSQTLCYDTIGRLQTRIITTDQAYQYDYTYNAIGALNTLAYPTSPIPNQQTGSRFTIQYGYSYGEPSTISDVTSGTATTLWSLTGANDYDLPTAETLYSSPITTVTSGYKPWTGELTSIQSGISPSSTNRQNLAYQWDTAGNLTQRADNNQSLTEIFTPDTLNRLQSSTLNGVTNLTVGYDGSGNITSKSDVGTYSYPSPTSARPHGVTAAGSFSFTYDANGNVATRNGLTQTWASFNLPTSMQATVSGSTYASTFWYGPDHQRWRQYATYSNGTENTLYAGGLLEKVTPSTTGVTQWRHYVNTPSGLTILVSRNSDRSYSQDYVLSDHLGSSDAVLKSDGSSAIQESFTPFGARRGSAWSGSPTVADWTAIANTTRHGFTFHEHLDNIGLIHANGRTYDPIIGRFMSVDPIVGDLADSQSVNPYAYVGNRPLSSVDPSGLDGGCFDCYPESPVPPQPDCIFCNASTVSRIVYPSGTTGPGPETLLGQSAQTRADVCAGSSSLACFADRWIRRTPGVFKNLGPNAGTADSSSATPQTTSPSVDISVSIARPDADILTKAQDAARRDPANQPKVHGDTYCNFATCAILSQVGVQTEVFLDRNGDLVSANGMSKRLANSKEWRKVGPEEAQRLANEGKVVVAVQPNGNGHGHIATVRPDPNNVGSDPTINNIGRRIAIEPASRAFSKTLSPPQYYTPID